MGSLKEYDTPKNQIEELKLSTKPQDRVVIWVEGNDWKLYHRFFVPEMVDRQGRKGGHSCHSVIESYEEYKRQYPDKLAIVIRDADFERANGKNLETNPDVFYADCHDHEMMCICQAKVREALMANYMIENKDDAFFTKIFDELLLLSYFQWYNYNNSGSYNFDTLGNLFGLPDDFFKDPAVLEDTLYKRSTSVRKKKGITEPMPRVCMEDYADFMVSHNDPDSYEITNGHDFYNRINYHIQKVDESVKRSEDTLKESIYMAFSFVFSNTQLYSRLTTWCENNKTYILKAS